MTYLGRVFSLFIVVFGATTVAYGLSILVSFLVEGEIKDVLGVYRMKKEIMSKKGHIIVCGYGTIGKNVADKLSRENEDFVVVESSQDNIADAIKNNFWTVKGDATIEETLTAANIMGASGLISALSTDSDNLIVCMTAKDLNPDLTIVSRVTRKANIKRFIGVGVERVILPEYVGGIKMADALLHPKVADVLGGTGMKESMVQMDDIPVERGSDLIGMTLNEIKIPQEFGVIMAAIERDGDLIVPPMADDEIKKGDILFVVGKKENLKKLRGKCCRQR